MLSCYFERPPRSTVILHCKTCDVQSAPKMVPFLPCRVLAYMKLDHGSLLLILTQVVRNFNSHIAFKEFHVAIHRQVHRINSEVLIRVSGLIPTGWPIKILRSPLDVQSRSSLLLEYGQCVLTFATCKLATWSARYCR